MVPSASGAHILFSSSTVRQVAQSFSLFTTTVRASLATIISVNSIPAAAHSAASSSLIGRDALEMSVSPAQNFLNPPPVPEVPTETLIFGFSSLNNSPAAAASGATVDEPSTRISDDDAAGADAAPSESALVPPQAARSSAAGITTAATFRLKRGICLIPFGRRTSLCRQSIQGWQTDTFLKVNAR